MVDAGGVNGSCTANDGPSLLGLHHIFIEEGTGHATFPSLLPRRRAFYFGTFQSPLPSIAAMSRLSPALKAAINAPFARSGPLPAPDNITAIYCDIQREATSKSLGVLPWLALTVRFSGSPVCMVANMS